MGGRDPRRRRRERYSLYITSYQYHIKVEIDLKREMNEYGVLRFLFDLKLIIFSKKKITNK